MTTPDRRRRSPVNLLKHRIEPPQAAKAGKKGNLRYRQVRLGQKAFCPLHPRGLGHLQRAGAQMFAKQPREMASANPDALGQRFDRGITPVEKALLPDQAGRLFHNRQATFPGRAERCGFRQRRQGR